MKLLNKLAHLFWPRESNNHKAKILHSSSLTELALLLVSVQLVLTFLPRIGSKILGYAANIPPSEVIRLTNEKRAQNGVGALSENKTLDDAALAKGLDMLNKGYWSHVAPDGTQPWAFFTNFGYSYRFAGENLARDFSNPSSAVDAWMNSPSHRENLLNSKYKDIGVAVIEGNLAGVDTTIIVQFFGTKYGDVIPTVPVAEAQPSTETKASPVPTPTAIALATPTALPATFLSTPGPTPPVSEAQVLISPFTTTKGISLAVVGILLLVLVIDGLVTSRRRIARIGGRTFAHIAFLGMVLAIILILRAGKVL